MANDFLPILIQINALVWGVMAAVFWYKAGQVTIDIQSPSEDIAKLRRETSEPDQFTVNFNYLVRRVQRRER